MKLPIAQFFVFAVTLQSVLAVQVGDQPGFSVGRLAGDCAWRKCQIFRGSLLTATPVPHQMVRVRVSESLVGAAVVGQIVEILYVDPMEFTSSADALHAAWRGLSFSKDQTVTVVLALEQMRGAQEGEPLLVTTNDGFAETVRSVMRESARLEGFPEGIADAVSSLTRSTNGPLAGYLYAYVMARVMAKDIDTGVSLLRQMVNNPSVPPREWAGIVTEIGVHYGVLTQGGRAEVVRQFVDLAEATESQLAVLGFRGLAQIGYFHKEVRPMIGPIDAGKLTTSYRAQVKKGALARNSALESGLGIAYE